MVYIEHLLVLAFTVIGYISIFDFASLVGIPGGITCCEVRLNICVITAGIEDYKSIIKKMEKKSDSKIAKTKLNSTQVLNSKALIRSNITHDEFVSINNVLEEYDHKKN